MGNKEATANAEEIIRLVAQVHFLLDEIKERALKMKEQHDNGGSGSVNTGET